MNVASGICEILKTKGYEPMASVLKGKKDLWFRRIGENSDIEHFLSLEYKPTAKAYAVHVGVESICAKNFLKENLPVIRPFLSSSLQESSFLLHSPCWTLFDAGRALRWPAVYVIPNPKEPESWPLMMEEFFDKFLEPLFLPISNASDIRTLLFRTEPPFEWIVSPAVLRAAEVIALSCIDGLGSEEIMSSIIPFADDIEIKLAKGKKVTTFVDTLISTFAVTRAH
ncbi:hypothetical protein [Massilia sp. Mn16-1_5]|uniref:hypothetical protein n=1 Tax=Massilia sp. Mn16-1_5 TaxID=2079199 RepID=UPI00109E7BBC|nr:hypothetical protein [Massilia sp. Mn16-1_5]